jgi:hypothetical protein
MKVFLLIAGVALAAPAFAETPAPPPPRTVASKDGKTDFTKPFIYDSLQRQAPPPHQDRPSVELKADPGAR